MKQQQTPTTAELNKLAEVMIALQDKSQQVLRQFAIKQQHKGAHQATPYLFSVGQVYQQLWVNLLSNPVKFAQSQMSYWQDFMRFCQHAVLQWSGQESGSMIKPALEDRRFRDAAWEEHPLFNFIKQFYLLTAKHIQGVVSSVEGLDEKDRQKIEFYTRHFIDAVSPTNFLLTNPEVLRETLASNGENLLKGLDNMLDDLTRSESHLDISMTDFEAFEVGKNIAVTPGKVIYKNDLMELIQYEPQTKKVHQYPLLIVPPWINKYYILDLSAKNSFVNWIVQQGYTVFIVSWVNPGQKQSHKLFEDYMLEGPIAALDVITQVTKQKQINTLGFCIGGTLLACTLAYLAKKKDKRVVSATYLATLLDFSEPGDMGAFIDEEQINLLEHQMSEKGYLDGGRMSLTFNLLRANDLIWSYFIKNYLLGQELFPFDMLYWNADSTNMPAQMHSFYLRSMYLKNRLVNSDDVVLAGVPIDLRQIKTPAYFLSTQHDHIAPWKATYAGAQLQQGKIRFVLGGSGHIAGVINHPDKNKYQYYTHAKLPKNAEQWFSQAKAHEGSWWVDWEKWLKSYSGESVVAPKVGTKKFPVLTEAPGNYVREMLVDNSSSHT